MRKLIVLLVGILALASPAFGGPFGLKMGMTLEEIKKTMAIKPVGERSPNKYWVSPVPRPHSSFGGYIVELKPPHGVISIEGDSGIIDRKDANAQFAALTKSLERRYGHLGAPIKIRESFMGKMWRVDGQGENDIWGLTLFMHLHPSRDGIKKAQLSIFYCSNLSIFLQRAEEAREEKKIQEQEDRL